MKTTPQDGNKSAEDVFNDYINIRTVGNEVAANIVEAMKSYAKNVGERVRDVAAIRIYTEESENTLAKMKIIRDIDINNFIR